MIVTFYSFKGGVGRTFSLVETAFQLAAGGASVAVWDLDLEAPGLQKIPGLRCLEAGLITGTLDLLAEFEATDYTFPSRARLREALVKLPLPPALEAAGGCLSFLLPATLDESYPVKFSGIGWETLFAAEGAGPAFFHKVAAILEEDFDYLLVDSRTGFTDLSAVCTLQLPDLVVLVFNLNEQNLAGVESVHKAVSQVPARTAETQKVPILLLANMIPDVRLDLVEEKRTLLKEKGLSWHYKIPLRPELLLTDEIPSLTPSLRDATLDLAPLVGALETRRRGLEEDQERADAETLRRQGPAEKARSFEERVAELFSLQGHRVTRGYRRGNLEADLRLEIPVGTLPLSVLVECKASGRPATLQEVRDFAGKLQAFQDLDKKPYQGILVTQASISPRIEEEARQFGVIPQTYRQLLVSLAEPIPLEPAIHAFQGTALERLYVELEVVLESELRPGRVPEPGDATATFRRWLNQKGAGLFLLLGEAGSGKTCFCRRIAAELAQESQNERTDRKDSSARVPLHVDLRGAAVGLLETLLLQHLQRVAPKISMSPPALLHANREGLLVLLFDGFDEALVSPPQGSVDLLRELLRAVEGKAKVVLTCRPHLFRDRPELLPGSPLPLAMASRPATPLYEEVRERKGTEVAYVLDLSEERVEEYLRKALPPPGDWQRARSFIRETTQLTELAVRPFFLEIIVAALPHLERRLSAADLAHLYEVYGQAWFAADHRGAFDRTRRTALVEHLARLAWNAPQGRVHYQALAAVEATQLSDARPLSSETIDFELRTAPFLRRNAEGFYTFVHRSFLEFFVAHALRSGIAREDSGCLDLLPVTREVVHFLESWPEAERIPEHAGRVLEAPYAPARSENALRLLYLHARATVGLLTASWMEDLVPEQLDRIRREFSRLRPESLHLAGADLDGAVLPGADLRGAHLESARLAHADLCGAWLEDAFLAGADLHFARLRHARLARADLTAAVLDHVDLREADLSLANLRQTDLSFARMARSQLRNTVLENSRMRGAGLLGATISPQAFRQEVDLGSTHPELVFRPQFGPASRITTLAWSPLHRCLATVSGADRVAIWDVEAGEQLLSRNAAGKQFHALSWSPHGRWLAVAVALHGRDTLELWDAVSGKVVQSLRILEPVGCLAWSPTGKVLAASRQNAGTIAFWEMTPGEASPLPALRWSAEEKEPALSLVWSPDGTALAATTASGMVRFWNASTLQSRSLDLSPHIPVALRWSPDGGFLSIAFREGGVETVFAESGVRVGGYEAPPPPVDTAAWSPAGDRLAVTANGTLRVADLGARTALLELSWENAEEILTSWAPDGSLLAMAAGDRPVEIRRTGSWETGPRLQRHEAIPPSALSWSPQGEHLAIGLPNGRVHLWDLISGEPEDLGTDSEAPVLCLSWQNEGDNLLAIRADATTCEIQPRSQTARPLERIGADKLLAAEAPSSEGRQIVILLEDGLSAALYEPGTAKPLRQVARTESSILAFALSAENTLALACDDGTVQLWSTLDSGPAESTPGNSQKTVSLAWSPKGHRLAVGTLDGLIRLRDLEGHRPLILSGHEGRILAIAWSPQGDQVASAAADGMVLVWDAKTGSRLQAFPAPGRVSALAWAPEGERLAVAHDTGVDFRNAPTGTLRASLYALTAGPLAVSGDGYVTGALEALGAVRFGEGWALYALEDVPERLSPERVSAMLRSGPNLI